MDIFSLPSDILLKIFSYLEIVVTIRHTCGFFDRIISSQKRLNIRDELHIKNKPYSPDLFKYSKFIRWMTEHGYYRGNRLFEGIVLYGFSRDLEWVLDQCYCQLNKETDAIINKCGKTPKVSLFLQKLHIIEKYKKIYGK